MIRATGGFKFTEHFKASREEIERAAEKVSDRMLLTELKVLVAEDLLRHATVMTRCFEGYQARCKAVVQELAAERRQGADNRDAG